MYVVIDRFEGDFAVVETESGDTVNMARVLVPQNAHEGDAIRIEVDTPRTEDLKKEVEALTDSLFVD